MKRRTLVLAAASSVLGACATRASIEDGTQIKPSQGLLAFHITSNTNATLAYVTYEKESSFGSRFAENLVGPKGLFSITQGIAYFVTPVDPGEYMWSRFSIPGRQARLHSSNRFEVKASAITYIGHINVESGFERVRLAVADREDDMRAHLREKFPKYLQTMSITKAIAQMRL